ncbi:uncharacterized protein At3g28850 [Macadamia integrifolia]|uniref:uncharacterized protein At3g28850 n=1 Tax=Macadamia integrifolia TaxID=60698 RepID=UPI001C4F59F5|nr:uncharacterized protein At3g28850 [Macadamia integrifolia]
MGCASSKQSRCRHCGKDPSLSRSNSVPLHLPMPVHHPAQRYGESHHIVALTSSTLGFLKLDSPLHNHYGHHDHISTNGTALYNNDDDDHEDSDDASDYSREKKQRNNSNRQDKSTEKVVFSRELRIAKTWSDMINEKIPKVVPKTPVRTPPGEPENINTWELMEGLEDSSHLRLPNLADPERCFSFNAVRNCSPFDPSSPKLKQENGNGTPIPLWLQMSESDPDPDPNPNPNPTPKPIVSDFDPDIISTFRKALEDISPTNTSLLQSPEREKITSPVNNRWCLILASKEEAVDNDFMTSTNGFQCPPGGENKVVIYFTSLRGVRKTYDDCCQVRLIMKELGVRLDERDVSMHFGFKEELKELLGDGYRGGGLPRVFVKGNYIGGVDEIKQLHEDGGLEKLVHGCEKVDDPCGGGGGQCEACGDIRFVPCKRCSGSCKIYYEGGDEEEEEEEEEEGDEDEDEGNHESECGFIRCPDCNENGIIRCPVCCS